MIIVPELIPFFFYRAVNIVYTEAERDLGQLDSQHDPECLEMVEVVKHQSAD